MRQHFPSTGRGACPARGQYPPVGRRAPRLKREIVKMRWRVLTGFPKAREKRVVRKNSVARLLERAYSAGWHLPIRQELPRATVRSRPGHLSGAERHRRSESGAAVRRTRGRRTGLCFGLCFWPVFGLKASSAVRRIAGLVAQRLYRSGGWATDRPRQAGR